MIIQCEQCKTKFKLDDAKVKDKGVKVRCAKCRNVFTVSKDPSQLAEKPDFAAMLKQNSDAASVTATPVAFEIEHEPVVGQTAGFDFDTSAFGMDEHGEKPSNTGKEIFELEQDDAAHQVSSTEGFDLSGLAFNDEAGIAAGTSAAGGKMDFSEIAADGIAHEVDKEKVDSSSFTDFKHMDVSGSNPDQVKPDLEGFMDAIDSHEPAGFDMPNDTNVNEAFNLGEIDFGDELSAHPDHQLNPEKLEDDHGLLFIPLEESHDKVTRDFDPAVSPVAAVEDPAVKAPEETVQEELPPLSISSRRKSSSSMFTMLTGLLVVGVVAIMAYLGMNMNSGDNTKPIEDSGRIVLKNINASFVKNNTVGDLLVISGEAVNSYPTPRAAIQVMGTVYGADNKVLLTKNAYAGNLISKEQLATMSAEKIESAMSNQFGDSLANMEVAPGKSIPFVVVMSKIPAEAKQFSCNMIGSTGAAPPKK